MTRITTFAAAIVAALTLTVSTTAASPCPPPTTALSRCHSCTTGFRC